MTSPAITPKPPPPLQNGDRLTRAEFERRYDAMPQLKKAELIGGVVYMPSPVNHRKHSRPHCHVIGWLAQFAASTPGVDAGDNASLRLDDENMPQPDGFLMILSEFGGQARIDTEGYIEGAPELIAEIAASSVNYDLHDKLQTYRQHGVKEYIVWRVLEQAIDWFILRGTDFEPLAPTAEGIYQSLTFPGLWLDVRAMLAGNLLGVFQVVQQGLASPAHQAFVEELQRRAATAS
jgi:Uma2 family endonuclease